MEAGGGSGADALGVPGGNEERSKRDSNQKNETMNRLVKSLRYHSGPGVLVVLVVLVLAVGVGLGSGDGVGRWWGVGAGRQAMAEVWSLL